ncbi:plasmid mobilization protein [Chitinophaga japonensis]|uniref:Mobilization protein MobC n=1 Tax=Chitinophaga japonensis TaxID=104662 RepID=A0A562T7W2_CHIJA|nr:mobilization protein [Chitinophaga japonensis]TWI89278.1 hypothetical protein LX66_3373 [Chitinophaga japonensis]
MEAEKVRKKNKGGRPKKLVKREACISVHCSLTEKEDIEKRAKAVLLDASNYLREMGLTGKIDSSHRPLPGEVLEFTGLLNHLSANMNQIARKRNSNDVLSDQDCTTLMDLAVEIKALVTEIKSYIR